MLVVGVPPFMANNEIELAKKVKYNEVTFPEECHQGEQKLNPHLMHLIKQMLEKNPEMRPCLGDVMIHEWVTAEGSEPLPPLFDGGAPRRNSLDEDQDDEVVELIDIDDSLIFVKESGLD